MPFAGKAFVEMGVTGQAAFKAAFAQMQLSVRQFQAGIERVGSSAFRGVIGSLTTMRRMMGSLIGQATALGAAFGISVGIKDAIDNAAELESVLLRFDRIFGDSAAANRKWGEGFAAEFKRARVEVLGFMAQTRTVIAPFQFDPTQSDLMSKALTRLAYDLAASTPNTTDAEAFTAIISAMTGETEPMKRFGAVINETAVATELLNNGLEMKNATEAQKVMARYNVIIRATEQAHGALEAKADTFGNKMKEMQAAWRETSTAIGTAFLPYVTMALDMISQLISSLGLNATAADNTGRVMGLLGQATQYITGPLDLVIRGFNLLRGSLAFVVGMAATATDVFVGLFRLLANNPLTRGMFGEDFVRQVDTIAGAVQQAAKDAAEQNKQVMLESFDIVTTPANLGDAAFKDFQAKMQEMKAKFDAEVEAGKKAREEKMAQAEREQQTSQQARDEAMRGAFQLFDKEALAEYTKPPKPEAPKEIKEAGDRAVQLASPQSLEATAVGTFEKFRENAMNQQIVLQKQQAAFLQQIVRVLKDPQTAIMEFTT